MKNNIVTKSWSINVLTQKKGTSIDFLKLWEVWMGVAMLFQGENDFHGIPRVKHLNFTHSANGPR